MLDYKFNTETLNMLIVKTLCTQNEFAKRIGVDKGSVSAWLREIKRPRLDKIQLMIEYAKHYRIKLQVSDFIVRD